MKKVSRTIRRLRVVIAAFFLLPVTVLCAQESVLTASKDAVGAEGSVSYSIGQVAVQTNQAAEGILTEGVQQPYEILFMTGISDPAIELRSSIYPNPATTEVTLKVDRISFEGLEYRIETMEGKLLEQLKIESKETVIPLSNHPAGIYFVSLLENTHNLASYKVIKK